MSSCEEVQAQAMALAALSGEEPQRRAAETHALECSSCKRALQQGRQLLGVLDAGLAQPPPPPELRARIESVLLAEMRKERTARTSPLSTLGVAAAAAAALVIPWAIHWPVEPQGRSMLHGVALIGLALIAAATARSLGPLAIGATVVTSLVTSLTLASGDHLLLRTGWVCFGIELATAAVPVTLAYVLTRKRVLSGPPTFYMMTGAAGAMVGQAALVMRCPAGTLMHLLAFHSGGVFVALGLAGLAARYLLRPSRVAAARSR